MPRRIHGTVHAWQAGKPVTYCGLLVEGSESTKSLVDCPTCLEESHRRFSQGWQEWNRKHADSGDASPG